MQTVENFNNTREELLHAFEEGGEKFKSVVLAFYHRLGFAKYYAEENSMQVKAAATGENLVKLKIDDVGTVKLKRQAALEFSRIFAEFPLAARIDLVEAITAEVESYAQAFALIFATDTGKPVQLGVSEINGKGAQWAKWASGDVLECLQPVLRHKNAEKRAAKPGFSANDIVSLTTRVPCGDVAAFGGYNYLYALIINKLAQSIIAGNGTIIKAGQQGAHWVFFLVDTVIPAAIDKFFVRYNEFDAAVAGLFKTGLCQVVVGRRDDDPLLKTAFLAFTGSDSGAEAIAAERGIGRSVFERGGNSPVIISPVCDVDWRKLARDLIAGLSNSGQRCTAPRQVYLLKGVEQTDFVKYLNEELETVARDVNYIGNPYKLETRNGPVVDAKAAAKMREVMAKAVAEKRSVVGGERILGEIYPNSVYLKPAAIYWNSAAEEPEYREEMQHEVFAPLIQVVQSITLEQAVEFNNRSPQQLAGAIFSNDEAEIAFTRENIKCGSLQVNTMPSDPSPLAPHVDDAGHADGGFDSLAKYTVQKVIEGPYHLIKNYAYRAEFIFLGN